MLSVLVRTKYNLGRKAKQLPKEWSLENTLQNYVYSWKVVLHGGTKVMTAKREIVMPTAPWITISMSSPIC